MTERKNLPVVIAAQAVAVLSEQRSSLVARGLMALQESKKSDLIRNSQDERYRQARVVFNRGVEMGKWTWTERNSPVSGSFGMGKCMWNAEDNPDYFSAFKAFQQLADENYGKAYYPLYRLYSAGQKNIQDDHNRNQHFAQLAFDWCFANRSNQDAELWCDLGEICLLGIGVEQDIEQAVCWFSRAAKQGYAQGQWRLGEMYDYGSGVEEDKEQAFHWVSKAAEQNYAHGQSSLGSMYSEGYGVEQDDEQAIYWFRKAAEQGEFYGQWELGRRYRFGDGVEQSDEQAVCWFRNAAEQGNVDSQQALKILGIDWKK
jgi:TPR repeat protein